MRLMLFFKLMIVSLCVSLLSFALLPDASIMGALKMMALGTVISIGIVSFYPEVRGIKAGDSVSVVAGSGIPSIIGRMGTAVDGGKRNDRIKISLSDGAEVIGVVESYVGLISPPRIRILYEERMVD